MLLEEEGAPGEGDVVIGGEEGDQAEGEATDGLGEAEAVEPEEAEASLGVQKILGVWRRRRWFAAGGRSVRGWSGRSHSGQTGAGAEALPIRATTGLQLSQAPVAAAGFSRLLLAPAAG